MLRLLLLLLLPGTAMADSLVAARTIRAQAIVAPDDVTQAATDFPGALTRAEDALGLEARVTIYAGRPVRAGDLGPPAIIERNQIVAISFLSGGLAIRTEGRALARGGVGDEIRVMNLASRSTVTGTVAPDGRILVGALQ
ncbi:MAG: flagella basal body P-ring formation protein FlgA [Cereibacter sphaeroides]|uniref:Flagella basal body P-ring formation protein FlgA n=1 Tax=Cereibacter sphaeroides TaxID=1063 RepID=A0A2W5S725_CERSP|nr:MAG: flagella basal body P-ring formation protein FlgA [Cereibacter sphaeroides]